MTIREKAIALYKPPFRFECGYIFDRDGHMFSDKVSQDISYITQVRGWGRIGKMDDAEALQDEVGALIAEILTEHWPTDEKGQEQ